MSDRILKALMQLFAIIASSHEGSFGRDIVALFLRQQLNHELVEEYLQVFDQYVLEHQGKLSGGDTKKKKRTSVNSVKVLRICMQINSELTQKQKFIVLIRLIEYINAGGKNTAEELEFVSTVSDTFNIDPQDFVHCLSFITTSSEDIPDFSDFLIIESKDRDDLEKTLHVPMDGLNGQIRVLRVESVNMYFLRFTGEDELSINGQHLDKNRTYVFNPGASIRGYRIKPIYYSDVVRSYLKDQVEQPVEFVVDKLTYHFPGGKIGLHELSFKEESGKMVGIMGASGSGKSTLLSLLNGSYIPSGGAVTINGINVHKESWKLEGVVGHISQDDLLMDDLTVYQNLFFNAKLCFENYSDFQIHKTVITTLKSLGLYEIKEMKVGNPLNKKISGGQRKRLNIALELIREPTVLFVDEPTSGLSSRDSENIMDLLKELSLKGKLVFVVIHQPSSEIFKMFDNLLIMDTGGYPVYYGDPIDAVTYFKDSIEHVDSDEVECYHCGNVNPEQIFNIIELKILDEYGQVTSNRKMSPKQWYKLYKEKNADKEIKKNILQDAIHSAYKVPSKLKQLKVFILRDVLSKLSNKQYLAINLLEAPLLAFILAYLVKFFTSEETGYVFMENANIPAYIFMCVVVALFIGLTVSAEEIIKDQKILKREAFLNLSRSSYLISKILIMFTLSGIQTLTYVLLGNWILEIQALNTSFCLVLFSTFCFANMLGLNISSSFNSAVTIYILIPFLIIPQLLLSGVIVKFDELNPNFSSHSTVPMAGEVMASKWAYEALAIKAYKNNLYEKHFYEFDKQMSVADYKKNFWIPEMTKKIDNLSRHWEHEDYDQIHLKKDVKLVHDEIEYELNFTENVLAFEKLDKVNVNDFTVALADDISKYLQTLTRYYVNLWNKANNDKDKLVSQMNQTKEQREAFIKLKLENYNESLADLVRNKNDLKKISEMGGRFIQRTDPVFLDPQSDLLRSQFFAPRKKLFGIYIDTFWANILVLWFMSISLMITLYFDVLKRLISIAEELPERFAAIGKFREFMKK